MRHLSLLCALSLLMAACVSSDDTSSDPTANPNPPEQNPGDTTYYAEETHGHNYTSARILCSSEERFSLNDNSERKRLHSVELDVDDLAAGTDTSLTATDSNDNSQTTVVHVQID